MENIKVKQSDFSYDKESITIKFYLNDQPKSYCTGFLTFMTNQLEKFFSIDSLEKDAKIQAFKEAITVIGISYLEDEMNLKSSKKTSIVETVVDCGDIGYAMITFQDGKFTHVNVDGVVIQSNEINQYL